MRVPAGAAVTAVTAVTAGTARAARGTGIRFRISTIAAGPAPICQIADTSGATSAAVRISAVPGCAATVSAGTTHTR